jgi:tetratricopeptide (TPR) repeat protein
VRRYERGVEALQRRQFGEAAEILQGVLDGYPEEKELHERVRLYLNVCRRQSVPPDATPRSVEERVYAATLALNTGSYQEGLAQLEAAVREHPNHDHVQYMLAVVHAALEEYPKALSSLERAIELNPENRSLAWQDPDLGGLREHPRFRAVVGGRRSGAVRPRFAR